MRKRRQNLLLFYENKRYALLQKENIGPRLVKCYMNKFCIDEKDQCEINGIFSIQNRPPYLEERDMGLKQHRSFISGHSKKNCLFPDQVSRLQTKTL